MRRRRAPYLIENMVRPSGLEPPTPTMSRWCSNQLSYGRRMVRLIGLEPTTPTMSRWCSNQLSYKRRMVRSIGLEPTTPTMSRWCSNQLSYERTTGTNISGRDGRLQEESRTFRSVITRLRNNCAKWRESNRLLAVASSLPRGAVQNHTRRLVLQEPHTQHDHDGR